MSIHLVTGGAGFIGSSIVARLVELGETVRVLDDFSTGARCNLEVFGDKVQVVHASICDRKAVWESMEGVDICLHQAAIPSVPRSIEDPLGTNDINVGGTLNVLCAAREKGVKRLIFASSSSVYGDSPILPKEETMAPRPQSPYAVQKMAGEYYTRMFYDVYGLETVSLRYFNVFGPKQPPDSPYAAVIPLFASAALNGNRPIVFGDGEQSRDFCYIDNVVDANLLSLEAPAKAVAGKAFNIACGVQTSLNELLDLAGKALGFDLDAEYTTPRPGDVKHSLAAISEARESLGYDPKVNVADGLARTVEWCQSQHSTQS